MMPLVCVEYSEMIVQPQSAQHAVIDIDRRVPAGFSVRKSAPVLPMAALAQFRLIAIF